MPDDQHERLAARRGRVLRLALVFVLVVVAATLLGRIGSGIGDGPANVDGAGARVPYMPLADV